MAVFIRTISPAGMVVIFSTAVLMRTEFTAEREAIGFTEVLVRTSLLAEQEMINLLQTRKMESIRGIGLTIDSGVITRHARGSHFPILLVSLFLD
mmetsp:Transcript_11807/g.17119  ORF Transcript_11807/g.17119 Transcript_11807/m.17119 type:complete len:95 (-) Transcript_11807:298-582(-)